jgi:hypothetical protein
MSLEKIFENGALTYEQFSQATSEMKLVDLSSGDYVSKLRHNDELRVKDEQITTLNETLKTRDNDLEELRKKLESAGTDGQKLSQLTNEFSQLQTKYNEDVEAYKKQLQGQAYEFAVREFANAQSFSSDAAKRDFTSSLLKAELTLDEKNGIIGASDFLKMYSENNADAFKDTTSKPNFINKANDVKSGEVTKEMFSKMSYASRVKLFRENKELYDRLAKE